MCGCERVALLITLVLYRLGSISAPLEQQRVQNGLWPMCRVVQTVFKRVMETGPHSRLRSCLRGQSLLGWGSHRSRHCVRDGRVLLFCHLRRPGLYKVLVVFADFGNVGLAMQFHVFAQGARMRVTFFTASDLARVGFIAGVNVRMLLPVTAVCKSPIAALKFTFKRFLT